jgi:hypothetical protein
LPHAVQKSKDEKRQKDADDCVKQAFFSEDHVSNVPLKTVSVPLPFLPIAIARMASAHDPRNPHRICGQDSMLGKCQE